MTSHRYHRRRFLKTASGAIAAGTATFHVRIGGAGERLSPCLTKLRSPILLRGDDKTAFRDPIVLYHDGLFYLWYSYVLTEEDEKVYWYRALSTSRDLLDWSEPRVLTPKDQALNYCGPGSVTRFGDEWIMSIQTYPIPGLTRRGPVRWGTGDARIFIMRSRDLADWSEPELLRVKGPDVSRADMGRIIDPYLVEDKDEPGKWWCFFKQRGVSYSWSRDLETWTFHRHMPCGESVCVLVVDDEYVLFHSPRNGIGVKRSKDLEHWRDCGDLITLGQADWPWAETRLTAAVVVDLRREPSIGKFLMFFHGVGPGRTRTMDNTFANCSIGIAWSDDLVQWDWPCKA